MREGGWCRRLWPRGWLPWSPEGGAEARWLLQLVAPQLGAEGSAAALLQGALLVWAPPWEAGALQPRGLAKQGFKAGFSLLEEVSLSQHNRGVSAAPAPCLGSWAACWSQSRPWKKRQHQAPSLELCMRRSAYQNLPLSRGRLSGDAHGAGSQPCMQRAALPVPRAWPRSRCCGARS